MLQVTAPIELLYDIIEEVWESTLTPEERINFMTASTLVSREWSTMFDKISSSNMHIPCESFYHKVFSDGATRDYSKCKRLTFTVFERICVHSTEHFSARFIRTLSYMRHDDITKLISLNTIHIMYYNSRFPDPYVQGFLSAIPDGLPNLVISYVFSPDISSSSIQHHRRHFKRESRIRYAEPRIGTLVVNGADEYVAATWESLFPTRDRLIRDGRQEAEPLLGVTSLFVPEQALLVRLEDVQRQRDEDGRRANIKPDARKSVDIIAAEADGITFISSNSAVVASPPRFPPSTFVGELGYVDATSETFVPLFNTFEPLILDATSTIPSLYGYGNAKIQTKSVRAESPRNYNEERKGNWVKKLTSLLKVQEKNMKYIDSSQSGAAANWFEQNVDRVVGVYGKQYGTAVEDMVLGITVS